MDHLDFARVASQWGDAPWLLPAVHHVVDAMEQDGGHDFGHLVRVLLNAQHIADGEDVADREVLTAAVLFHDVVNLPKNHPERHRASTLSADRAVAFLRDHEFSPAQLDLVHEAVRCHSFSSGLVPTSLEARIVSDADNLEAIGALGIARTFYVGGRMGTAIVDQTDPFAQRRELDDTAFSIDHFFRKLLGLVDKFYTKTGRAMAEQRHAYMRGFLEQFAAEIGRPLPREVTASPTSCDDA